ncbi:hypothetical protein PQC07_gp130 [Aeromonas phage D3]|uniref:Uncharacterized protein n=1 Tax=Aeromonas phage D3 TaxID=2593327 RepID=A0A7D6IQN1_9CAUD|nr:hypothetical protein PQC07_gp130 [Aeromonas phage D3]QLM02902.1 hypothetical protein D3_0145 [Aeromonas phage D3]
MEFFTTCSLIVHRGGTSVLGHDLGEPGVVPLDQTSGIVGHQLDVVLDERTFPTNNLDSEFTVSLADGEVLETTVPAGVYFVTIESDQDFKGTQFEGRAGNPTLTGFVTITMFGLGIGHQGTQFVQEIFAHYTYSLC